MGRTYVLLLTCAVATGACTAGFRSTEWLALESRLIVVGEVTASVPAQPERSVVAGDPAILTVRVRRVVKGSIPGDEILVRTGPVRSCDPDGVYHTIRVGDSGLFALVGLPREDVWQIEWTGGFRPATEASLFEAAIERARSIRNGYVDGWRRRALGVIEAASRLDERLRELSASWPADARETHWVVRDRLVEETSRILRGESVETISLALAVDIGEDLLRGWSGSPIWEWAIDQELSGRYGEFAAFGRARTRESLVEAGISESGIEEYMGAMEDRAFDDMFGFPFAEPGWDFELPSGPLTTDLLLRHHSYDRGSALAASILFGHTGSWPDLSRLERVVRELIESPDRYHRWAGRWIKSGGKESPPLQEIFLK
ncbi:MAG: hypothetical protein AAB434_09450 [Planctomycetota bacterium]